jgi:hypothetical protein
MAGASVRFRFASDRPAAKNFIELAGKSRTIEQQAANKRKIRNKCRPQLPGLQCIHAALDHCVLQGLSASMRCPSVASGEVRHGSRKLQYTGRKVGRIGANQMDRLFLIFIAIHVTALIIVLVLSIRFVWE